MVKVFIWSTIATFLLCFFTLQNPAQAGSLHALSASIPNYLSDSPQSWETEDPWQTSTKIEIAKIRSGVLPGVVIGSHHDGLLKIRQQHYVASGRLDEQLENSVYDLLENELSDAGFEIMRSHPQSLFEDLIASSEPSRFLIGGTITQEHLNSYSSFFNEYTDTQRSIRWELFDRDLNKVVYRQEIDGSAQVEGIDNPAATYEAIRASFSQLLHEPRFIALLNYSEPQETSVAAKPYKIEAIASTQQPLTLEELVGRSIPSIVGIRTPSGRGSGFLVDSSGLIVTNEHVVGSAFTVKVKLYDGTTLNGRVLRRDAVSDAALVKLEGVSEVSGLPICHTDVVRVGQSVVAIGNPLSLANTVTQGIVSGFRRSPSRSLIQTDTAVNPGNSGGPLLNRDGTVIGIVTEKIASEGIEGLGFALPIGEVLQRLNVSIDSPTNSKLDSCGNPLMASK